MNPIEEADARNDVRPATFDEFIGQDHAKALIRTAAASAKQRNAAFPHSLINSPAGLGKTSIARLIATEMDVSFISTTAEALEDSNSVKGILSRLDDSGGYDSHGKHNGTIRPSILFVDETHRMPRQSQELLYSCIEDRVLDTRIRDPLSGLMRPVKEWIPHYSLIAATNRPGDLTASFRDRLRLLLRLEPYSDREATKIARQALLKMGMKCGTKSAGLIATRGRGVPRRIIGLCEHARDIAIATGKGSITPAVCMKAFDSLGLDSLGLNRQDVDLLKALAGSIGQPLGLSTLSSLLGEDPRAIEESVEPYLIAKGLIARTKIGRALTPAGVEHLRLHGLQLSGRRLE